MLQRRAVETATPTPWTCPPEWVWHPSGGCGPAVLLCADPAAATVCPARPRVATDDDDAPTPFFRAPDGAVLGGWALRPSHARCADGWRDAGDGACEPDPRVACARGATRVEHLCVGGDARCTDAPFATVDGPAVYVLAGSSDDHPDGTRAHPYARLDDALDHAPEGATVLLSAGVWQAPLRVTRAVSIVGVCPSRTTLRGAAGSPVVDVNGVALTLANVTVREGDAGVVARRGASLTLRDVTVEGSLRAGVEVDDARATLDDVVVRGVVGSSHVRAAGVRAAHNADVTLTRVLIDDVDSTGVTGEERASIRATDVVIRNVRHRATEAEPGAPTVDPGQCPDPEALPEPLRASEWSNGVLLTFGAGFVGRHVVIEGFDDTGVFALHANTRFSLTESVIRDAINGPYTSEGKGLYASAGPRVELRDVLIEHTRNAGVGSFCPRTHVELHDVVVRDTRARGVGTGGRALTAQWGGTLTAHRATLRGSFNAGAMAYNGSTITLVDTAIFDTRASRDPFSAAVLAYANCTVRLDHVLLDGWEEGAIAAAEANTRVSVHQVIAQHGRESARGVGLGIAAAAAGTVDGDTLALVDAPGVGILADGARRGATARLTDVWIDGVTRGVSRGFYLSTVGASDDPMRPRILGASSSGVIELTRARLGRSPMGFVLAGDPGGALTLGDAVFVDVMTLGVDVGAAPPRAMRLHLDRVAGPSVTDATVRDRLP